MNNNDENENLTFITPVNFKDSYLIMGIWRKADIIFLLLCGVITMSILLFYLTVFQGKNIIVIIIMVLPTAIAMLLLMHRKIYQNSFGYFKAMINFKKNNKIYSWGGISHISTYKGEIDNSLFEQSEFEGDEIHDDDEYTD